MTVQPPTRTDEYIVRASDYFHSKPQLETLIANLKQRTSPQEQYIAPVLAFNIA